MEANVSSQSQYICRGVVLISMNSHLYGLNKKFKHLLLEYICFWFDDEFFKMLTQNNSIHQIHWRFYFCILSRKEPGKLCCTFLLRTLVLRGRVANAELHTQESMAGVKCPRTTLVSKQQQQKTLYVLLTVMAGVWLSCRFLHPHSTWKALGSTISNKKYILKCWLSAIKLIMKSYNDCTWSFLFTTLFSMKNTLIFVSFLFILDQVSCYSSGWPRTNCVFQGGFKLLAILLPLGLWHAVSIGVGLHIWHFEDFCIPIMTDSNEAQRTK